MRKEERILYACKDPSKVADHETLNTCERNPCCSSVHRMLDNRVLLKINFAISIFIFVNKYTKKRQQCISLKYKNFFKRYCKKYTNIVKNIQI